MLNFKLSFDETVFLCCFICFLSILIYLGFSRKYVDPRPRILFLLSSINLLLIAFYAGGLELLYYMLGSRGVVRYSFLLSLGNFNEDKYQQSRTITADILFVYFDIYSYICIISRLFLSPSTTLQEK